MDAFSLGKYSVGPPYFNAVFVPLMALLMPFMAVAPISKWREDTMSKWLRQLVIHGLFLGCLAFWVPYRLGGAFNLWVSLSILLAGWVVLGVLRSFWKRIGLGFGGDLALARISPSFIGMSFAHIGFAFLVLGAVVVTQNKEERDLRMTVGSTEVVGGYQFELLRFQQNMGPNYLADQAVFKVYQSGRSIATLIPEKRRYFSSGQIMTEAAIDAGFWRDLYIALGEFTST